MSLFTTDFDMVTQASNPGWWVWRQGWTILAEIVKIVYAETDYVHEFISAAVRTET